MKANIKINNVYLYLCIIYYLSAFIIGKLSYIKISSVKKTDVSFICTFGRRFRTPVYPFCPVYAECRSLVCFSVFRLVNA